MPTGEHNEDYLKEDTATMAVSFNGKARYNITVAADAAREDIEKTASKPKELPNGSKARLYARL